MTSFCIDRLVLPVGPTGKENSKEGEGEGESDPGRARWFAYSPLHNPVAVIHHASAVSVPVGRGDAKCSGALTRRRACPVCVVSTRAEWLARRVKRDALCPQPIPLARGFCLSVPFFLALQSIFPAEGIHDRTIARANLHPWNPRCGQPQPSARSGLVLPLLDSSSLVVPATDVESISELCF